MTISTPFTVVQLPTSRYQLRAEPDYLRIGDLDLYCRYKSSGNRKCHFLLQRHDWAQRAYFGGPASATGFSNMPAGSYTVVANYSGDSNFNPASNFTTLTITPSSNAVTLSCSPTSFVLGSTTTCTAVAPAPDGAVAFYSTADLSGKWWNSPFPGGGGDLGTTPGCDNPGWVALTTTSVASLGPILSPDRQASIPRASTPDGQERSYRLWTAITQLA